MAAVDLGVGSDEEGRPGPADRERGAVVVVVDGVELRLATADGRRPDLTVVDALARMQLAAQRAGRVIRLCDPDRDLCGLLDLVGLADVVAASVPPMAEGAENPLVEAMEAGWRRFRAGVDGVGPDGLDQPTPSGWTAKEMLAHVAFWDETVEPVIVDMYRGGSLDRDWAFGSGYTHPDGPWPDTDEHNAREAAWASPLPPGEVVARLDAAHSRALGIIRSLSDDELQDPRYQRYLGMQAAHYDEHLVELERLRPDR